MLRRSNTIDINQENVKTKPVDPEFKVAPEKRAVLGQKSTNLQLRKSNTQVLLNKGSISKPKIRRTNSLAPQIPNFPSLLPKEEKVEKNIFNRSSSSDQLIHRKEFEVVPAENDELEVTFDTDQPIGAEILAKKMGLTLDNSVDDDDYNHDLDDIEFVAQKDLPDLDEVEPIFNKQLMNGIWKDEPVSHVEDPLKLGLRLESKPISLEISKKDLGLDEEELELEFSDAENEQEKLNSIMEFYK